MSPIAAFGIAIGALTLIALIGWALFARERKQIGVLTTRLAALEAGANAQERQLSAIRKHLDLGDLRDDERFLREQDATGPT